MSSYWRLQPSRYLTASRFIAVGVALGFISTPISAEPKETTSWQEAIKKVSQAPWLGQGNPKVTKHPVSREQCQEKLKKQGIDYRDPEFERICGEPYMAPLYNPQTEKASDAIACIDQFEFPNIPCEYPVVWVRANEAQEICAAMGKRICDAHEWEGACAGSLEQPDYLWEIKAASPEATIKARRLKHNQTANANKVWAYGNKRKKGICAMDSFKHEGCNGGDWQRCGSNTYPAGYFPECKSALAVYDQHGNAAEHMNLPLEKDEMASAGSKSLGYTEMKGSWFIFDKYKAHADHCRWRAPFWHGTRLMDKKSHHNYHLGFRCCKSLK